MSADLKQEGSLFFFRWVRHTAYGWLLGLFIIIIMGILGDILGLGETDSQFMIGVSMGLGVGYTQGRIMKRWFGTGKRWLWASVLGLSIPFVAFDFAGAGWAALPDLLRLIIEVAIGGFLVGVLQWRVLSLFSQKAKWWVFPCMVGWIFAAGTAAIGPLWGSPYFGKWVNVVTILLGGVVLGVVTGAILVWIYPWGYLNQGSS